MATRLQQCTRAVVLITAPTSENAVVMPYLETAKELYAAYCGGEGERSKFRIIILTRSRFDLIAEVYTKVANILCDFVLLTTTLQRRDTQCGYCKPSLAIVIAPKADVTASEPSILKLAKVSQDDARHECLTLRCTSAKCPLRSTQCAEQVKRRLASEKHTEPDEPDRRGGRVDSSDG